MELVPVVDEQRAALIKEYEEATSVLTEPQRKYVESLLASGDPKAAAAVAGYESIKDAIRRMRAHPLVRRAVEVGRRLRETESSLPRDGMIRMLEGMLQVRLEDLVVRNDQGIPLDVKSWESLTTAQQRAVKTLKATVERTKLGDRAKLIRIQVDLWPPGELMKLLAQLRGELAPEGPTVNVDIGQGDVHMSGASSKFVDEILESLWPSDGDLARVLAMNDADRLAAVRERIAHLGEIARGVEATNGR